MTIAQGILLAVALVAVVMLVLTYRLAIVVMALASETDEVPGYGQSAGLVGGAERVGVHDRSIGA